MVLEAWRRGWWAGLVVASLIAAATTVTAVRLEPRSEALSVVSLTPRTGGQPLSAAQVTLLATKYVALASSDAVARDVARTQDLPPELVRDGLGVSLPERTTTLRVSMRTAAAAGRPAADVALAVVRGVVDAVVERASGDRYLAAEVVVEPDARDAGSGRARVLVVGLGLALLAGLLAPIAWVTGRRRPRAG